MTNMSKRKVLGFIYYSLVYLCIRNTWHSSISRILSLIEWKKKNDDACLLSIFLIDSLILTGKFCKQLSFFSSKIISIRRKMIELIDHTKG